MHSISNRLLVFLVGVLLATLPRIAVADNSLDGTIGTPPPIKAKSAAATIKQIKPDWCEGYKSHGQLFFDYPWPSTLVKDPPRLNSPNDTWNLSFLALAGCEHPENPRWLAWVTYFRQVILNQTRISDQELRQLFALLVKGELDGIDAQDRIWCSKNFGDSHDCNEPVRTAAGWLMGCFIHAGDCALPCSIDGSDGPTSQMGAVAVALGKSDPAFVYAYGPKIDPNLFKAELEALKPDPIGRWYALRKLSIVEDFFSAARKPTAGAEDEDVQKVAKAGEEAYKSWQAWYQANKAAMDTARDCTQRASSGTDVGDCPSQLKALLLDWVRARKPKTPMEARNIAGTDLGFWLSRALYVVANSDPALDNYLELVELSQVIQHSSSHVRSGPSQAAWVGRKKIEFELATKNNRSGAEQGVWVGGYRVLNVSEFESIDLCGDSWQGLEQQQQAKGRYPETEDLNYLRVEDEILSIKEKPEGLKITFKPFKMEFENSRCRETNKFERIDKDGSIHYRQDCRSTGTYTESLARKPKTLDRKWKNHLKPGRIIAFFDRGGVEAVYDNAKNKKLLAFGFLDEVFPVDLENP